MNWVIALNYRFLILFFKKKKNEIKLKNVIVIDNDLAHGKCVRRKRVYSSFLFFFFLLYWISTVCFISNMPGIDIDVYIYVHLDRIFFLFGAGTVDSSFSIVIHTQKKEKVFSTSAAHLHIIHMEKLSPIRSSFFFFFPKLLLLIIYGPRGFFFFLRRKREREKKKQTTNTVEILLL